MNDQTALALREPTTADLVAAALQNSPRAAKTFIEFFTATLPNPNTRAAYMRDTRHFFTWCAENACDPLAVTSVHLAAYRETIARDMEPTTVKRHFSALRSLYTWWVEKGVLDSNPVREVKTAKVSRVEGKTPVIDAADVRRVLEELPAGNAVQLRDRAYIAVMAYTFARVSAVSSLRVKDYATQGKRSFLHLDEKGGKQSDIPVHHKLIEYLDTYIEAAGIASSKDTPLFRAAAGKTGQLTERPLHRQNAYDMVRRRLKDAGIEGAFSCHSFRAAGITTFLENGGDLETAQRMAGHADSRTTKLYDRRNQRLSQADFERVQY